MEDVHIWMLDGFHHDHEDADPEGNTLSAEGRSVLRYLVYEADRGGDVSIRAASHKLGVDENTIRTGAYRWSDIMSEPLINGQNLRLPENLIVDVFEFRNLLRMAKNASDRSEALKLLIAAENVWVSTEILVSRLLEKNKKAKDFRKDKLRDSAVRLAQQRHTARLGWAALQYLAGSSLDRANRTLASWTRRSLLNGSATTQPSWNTEALNLGGLEKLWHTRLVFANELEILSKTFHECPPEYQPTTKIGYMQYFCHGYFQKELLDLAMNFACEQNISDQDAAYGLEYSRVFDVPARMKLVLESLRGQSTSRFMGSIWRDRGDPRLAEVLTRAILDPSAAVPIRLKATFGLGSMLVQPKAAVNDLLRAGRNVDRVAESLVSVLHDDKDYDICIAEIADVNKALARELTALVKVLHRDRKAVVDRVQELERKSIGLERGRSGR